MTTDLTTLSTMIAIVNEWDVGDTPTSTLLSNLFEVIEEAIPEAQTLRLFRVLRTYLIEIGTTDKQDKALPIPIQRYSSSVYSTGLRSKKPISPDEGVSWYYAPSRDNRQSVLMVLRLRSRPKDLVKIETIIKLAGDLINTAMQQRTSRVLLQRQATITSRLSQAETFHDIIHAISHNIIDAGRFVTLNLMAYDDDGQISGLQMVASGNQRESFEKQIFFPLPKRTPNAENIADSLQEGKHILFYDVQSSQDLDDQWKSTLDDKSIISLAIFPMRVQGQIIGTVNYLDIHAPIDLSDDELELMQSIADQAGSIISLRDLSEATHTARLAVNNLVSASRDITTASNYSEMTRAIKQTMAKSSSIVILTTFNETLEDGQLPNEHRLLGISLDEQDLDTNDPPAIVIPPEHFFPLFHQGQPVIITDDKAVTERITQNLLDALNLPVQNWMAIFPLRTSNHLIGTMSIVSEDHLILSEDTLASYLTLTDQIAMAVRSRQLLIESEQLQYVASQLIQAEHAITLTDDYNEMLRVIMGLLPTQIHTLFLVLFDRHFTSGNDIVGMTLRSYTTREAGEIVSITDIIDTNLAGWTEGMEFLKQGGFTPSEDLTESLPASPNIVRFYLDKGIESILTTGLRVGRNIIGLLVMGKDPDYTLRPAQEVNIRAIVDQLATTIENRQLLQQTSATLHETTTLYSVNRELINAQNEVDILRVLYHQAVSQSLGLISARVIYNVDAPQDLQIESFYNGELTDIDLSLAHEIGIGGVVTYIKAQDYPDLVFLSDVQPNTSSHAILKLGQLEKARSAVFMPIYDEERLLRLLIIGFEQPHIFDESQQRLYHSIRSQIQIVLQNQRLLTEMQKAAVRLGRQVRTLQTINHMSGVITSANDQKTLFDNTCSSLYNVLGVDHINVTLYERSTNASQVISEYPDHASVGEIYSLDDPVQARLLTEKTPIIVEDITRSEINAKMFSALKKIGIKTLILLPLLTSDEEFVGTIGLHFAGEGRIPPETIDIARTLTSQIIIAMQNIQLLDASRRQAERMERIATFSRSVQASLEVEELLQTGIQGVREIIPSDYASVILYDVVAGRPRRVAWQEFPSRIVVSLQGGSFVDLPATTSGTVWKTQEMLFVPDHQSLGSLQFSGSRHVRSSLSVPIFSRGVIRGVMELGNNHHSAYTITDRFILQQLVNQLAIAVENAEAYQQSQRVAQSKALVNDISIKLQQQTSIEQILNVTMNELGQALGAKRGRIRLTPDGLNKNDEGSSS
jgi:GAF domain-containing protein